MKHLSGIIFLVMLLMTPSLSWAEDDDSAGDSGDATAEQADSNGKPVNAEKKKKAKTPGAPAGAEPDCE